MASEPKPNDPAYKRLILFPLALFYIAVLVCATWPRQLSPGGRVVGAIQLAANHLLAQIAVQPSLNVFTGDTGGERTATVRTCYRISGVAFDGERTAKNPRGVRQEVLFDSMPRCATGDRDVVKDTYVQFQDKYLRRSLHHLKLPKAKRSLHRPPLNVLFGIADYHCHRAGTFDYVTITSRHQRYNLDTAELTDRTVVEGAHRCDNGRWEVLRAPVRPRGDAR